MNQLWRGTPLVFISYRSTDEPATANAVYTGFAARFGERAVFHDASSLPAGENFEPNLLNAVRSSVVLLLIIGTNWPASLHDPDDWVRREITEALRHGIRVLPVLVDDTPALVADQLPESIRGIAKHQFVRVHPRSKRVDIDALISKVVEAEPLLAAHVRPKVMGPAPVSHPSVAPVPWPAIIMTLVLGATIAVIVSAGASNAVVAAVAVVGTALTLAAWRATAPARPVATPSRLDAASEVLAAQVLQQTTDAAQDWRLDTPKVITRWVLRTTEEHPHRGVRTWTSGGASGVAELVAWYHTLPRKRLILLGEGGAGKTSLALLLIRHMCSNHQPGDRVPVLVPLAAWSPDAGPLHPWLAARLGEDFPALRAGEFGKDAVITLVRRRRLIPVLDGLDELPRHAQQEIMRVLADLSDDDAWIVTSRTEAFTALSETSRAGVDATLTAQPVSPVEVHAYLARAARGGPPVVGDDHPLISAMRTPLTLWLLDRIYLAARADPAPLTALTDPDAIRRHLLAHLVPRLLGDRGTGDPDVPFRPRHHWPADRAQRWLATLADHLTRAGTTELAWWALDALGPRHPRRVLAALLAVGTALLVGGTALVMAGRAGLPLATAFILLFSLVPITTSTRRPAPAFASFRLSRRLLPLLINLIKGLIAGVALGGLLWLGAQVSQQILPGYMRSLSLPSAMFIGIGLGSVFGLFQWAAVPTPLDSARTPTTVLVADRRMTLVVAGTLGAALSAVIGFSLPPGMSGATQLAVGLAIFPSCTLMTAFTAIPAGPTSKLTGHAWPGYLLTVGWAAILGRLPWRLMTFLADMRQLGILKQVGTTYQFRHSDLRDILARP